MASVSVFHFRNWVTSGLLLSALGLVPLAQASGGDFQVQFDVPAIVPFERNPVDTSWETRVAAGRQLIEIQLDVSSWLVAGKPERLEELLFEIVDLSGAAQVVDFQPRDEQTSEYLGGIAVEKTQERNRSMGIDASSTFDWVARGNAHAAIGNKTIESTRFEKKAPQQQIVVSGTTRQGRGVSFRFRRSIDSPLEGTQRLIVRLSVPEAWRQTLLRVDCAALGTKRGAVSALDQTTVVGRQRFLVPVVDREDPVAMRLGERYQNSARHLRGLVDRRREQIKKREVSDPLQRFGVMLAVAEPDIPREWLQQLIEQGDAESFALYADRLPTDVRQAGLAYLAIRQEFVHVR